MTRVGLAVLWCLGIGAVLSCQRPTGNGEGSDALLPAADAYTPTCGNGILDPGEVCDDGNTVGGDGCSADCKSDETCGNGIVDTDVGERCDDGNTIGGDGCSADCKSDETCGNGVVDTDKGETCDDGNTVGGDGCSANCQSNESCGNGIVDTDKGEQCDGGGSATPTCNVNCTLSKCGDGIVNAAAGEACDDGNTSDNDNCTHLCTVSRCGDGILDTKTEECDDGNNNNSDGCQNSCKLGPGNDTAAFAIDVSAGGTFTVDMTHAHDDVSESCSDPGAGKDVFYTFKLNKSEVVYADTFGSTFDTTLSLFPGACTARGAELVCDDDECGGGQSQIAGELGMGTYCLIIDQNSLSAPAGPATLTVRHGGRTGFDVDYGTDLIVMGNTAGSGETNQMAAQCATTGADTDDGYFFTTCPGEVVEVQADTCQTPSFDAVVYIRSALNIGSDQACNDDAGDLGSGATTGSGFPVTSCGDGSYVDVDVGGSAADLHWIVVDGWFSGSGSPDEGSYTLSYTITDD